MRNMNSMTRRKFIQTTATAAALSASLGTITPSAEAAMAETTIANNDNTKLTPKVDLPGRKLKFDFPGMRIGCAEYDEGPTGCTVFNFPKGNANMVADVRGGSHASTFMDYLTEGNGTPMDAICLAGGSCYGLEAASGVAAEILARRKYDCGFNSIACVTGAIIYDFRQRNAIYPDKQLGRAATKAAVEGSFPLGAHGAGRSATCGKFSSPGYKHESAGQGGAFTQVGDTKIACFTVVNAVGSILDRTGKVVRGTVNEKTGERHNVVDIMKHEKPATAPASQPGGNTTLSFVLTNRKLNGWELRQLARQVHTSMSRCIDPFHTISDGDILYAATTNEVATDTPNMYRLGVLASETMWDAVLSCYDA
jgi:6-aminohexanoate-oligomer endohydrolase